MKLLMYLEGGGNRCLAEYVYEQIKENEGEIKEAVSLEDMIYSLGHTDFEPDLIILKQDNRIYNFNFPTIFSDLAKTLNADGRRFPIQFGKVCKEICKRRRRKDPKVIIMTNNYLFLCPYKEKEIPMIDLHSAEWKEELGCIFRVV